MAKHLVLLAGVSLVITGVYARVTGAYFCSYDDFIEIHRAAFKDTQDPSRVLTVSHTDAKYRPLNHAVTLMTYWAGQGDPRVFRIRNLTFHLVNVGLVYALGWLLFRSTWVSGVGAALFGLHPLANQTTIGAVWPSTIAHAAFFLAAAMFIISVRLKPRLPWLIGSVVSGWLSLLAYEVAITVFGLMGVYLVGHWLGKQGEAVGRQFVVVGASVSGVLLVTYFVLRHFFVPRGWEGTAANMPSPGVAIKNLLMYLVALLSPVDPVFANELLRTPLPSEIVLNRAVVVLLGLAGLIVGGCAGIALWLSKGRWQNGHWAAVVFLISGVFLPLLPVLAFAEHPSETYLYVPVAFYGLLLSYGLGTLLVGPSPSKRYKLCVAAVLLLIILFTAATWVRNDRVAECARTARRILGGIALELRGDVETVFLANVPGEPVTRRYGFYGFRGVDTIGHTGHGMANRAVTSALQLVSGNGSLNGEIVEAGELLARCGSDLTPRQLCLWVHWDGRVERVQ